MPKWLVCRTDAVDRTIRSSEHFPCIVEAPHDAPAEEIVRRVFAPDEYRPAGKRSYYVLAMTGARKITFTPRAEFTTEVSYCE